MIARNALAAAPHERIVWIGKRTWSYLGALVTGLGAQQRVIQDRTLLRQSIFVDAPSHAERLWAIDLALRCPGVCAVIADGSALTMPESRRLQLAAQTGNAIGLIARPSWELRVLSAARTRWVVAPAPDPNSFEPRWTVELLRCKGVQPTSEAARRCAVLRNHETGDVSVAAHVADRHPASPGTPDGSSYARVPWSESAKATFLAPSPWGEGGPDLSGPGEGVFSHTA